MFPFIQILFNICYLCSFWWWPFWSVWGGILLQFCFAFPWWLVTLNIFSRICCSPAYLLQKKVYSAPLPIFYSVFHFLLLSYISSLHILDINSIPDIRLAYIFSHSVSCLFILMMVSFTVQKLYSLMESHLLFFAFVSLSFGVRTTKTLLTQMSWRLPSMSSSRNFLLFQV